MNNCDKVCFQFLCLGWGQQQSICRPDNVAKSQSAEVLKRAIQLLTTTRWRQDPPNTTKCWLIKEILKHSTKLAILDSWRDCVFTFLDSYSYEWGSERLETTVAVIFSQQYFFYLSQLKFATGPMA